VRAAELNVGVYQPSGVTAAVLPELLKPWALAAGIRVAPLRPEDLRAYKFKNVDVVVFADADNHAAVLNLDPASARRSRISCMARRLCGICAGCLLALDGNGWICCR